MDIYTVITDGIRQQLPAHKAIEKHLEDLQTKVKGLRRAYFSVPVNVEYSNIDIQAAYLLTYFPHYYQLIYSILNEKCPEIFSRKSKVSLVFVGGGPGSEVYGVLRFIANNCPSVDKVEVYIMDINGTTWAYSHNILRDHILRDISGNYALTLTAHDLDITSGNDTQRFEEIFSICDLLVVQNCLNEIAESSNLRLIQNFERIFGLLKPGAHLLLCDLTSGARPILRKLENYLANRFELGALFTTLGNPSPTSIVSVHHRPSELVSKYLLNGSDGLIPRKYIKYDYSLLLKEGAGQLRQGDSLGFQAVYNPLDFSNLDPNGYLKTKVFIGLDFGTSCSVASLAHFKDGEISLSSIPIAQADHLGGKTRDPLVPSYIALLENRLLVGRYAAEIRSMTRDGENCWHGFKQNMHNIEDISFPNSELAGNPAFRIANGSDALILFFRYLKREIDAYLSKACLPLDAEYGISIPAAYSSKEKYVLKTHLELAGIRCMDVPFIEEPTAALVNYLFKNPREVSPDLDENYMVLDIGAGTVDVSIMQLSSDSSGMKTQLLSVMRIGDIGSNQIDLLLSEKILRRELKFDSNSALISLLQEAGEKLKIKLCKTIHLDATVGYALPGLATSEKVVSIPVDKKISLGSLTEFSVSYNEFDSIMSCYWVGEGGLSGILGTVMAAMVQAKKTKEQINRVILSGGGARNPYIRAKAADLFGADKLFIPDDLQEQVSRGTALHSIVVNCFGKTILNSLTSEPIFIKGDGEEIQVFDAGESIPSEDCEFQIGMQVLEVPHYLMAYFGTNQNRLKYFEIPAAIRIDKLVLYIDTDQELRCDVVSSSVVYRAKELYKLTNLTYINVNS